MVPRSKPAAPLFPSTSEAAVVNLISTVGAPISMRLSLRFRGEAADAHHVSLAVVYEGKCSALSALNRLLYLKQT